MCWSSHWFRPCPPKCILKFHMCQNLGFWCTSSNITFLDLHRICNCYNNIFKFLLAAVLQWQRYCLSYNYIGLWKPYLQEPKWFAELPWIGAGGIHKIQRDYICNNRSFCRTMGSQFWLSEDCLVSISCCAVLSIILPSWCLLLCHKDRGWSGCTMIMGLFHPSQLWLPEHLKRPWTWNVWMWKIISVWLYYHVGWAVILGCFTSIDVLWRLSGCTKVPDCTISHLDHRHC